MKPETRNQIIRFVRLFVFVLLPQLIALDLRHVGRSVIVATIVGALEVTFRQLYPVVPVRPNSLG